MTATLSSTYGALTGANCIDGTGEMCHTNNDATPWIAIDYGTRVIVERVEIFNRGDCCGERTRNVDVRISDKLPTSGNQMFSGGHLLGHFAGPATDSHEKIIQNNFCMVNSIQKSIQNFEISWIQFNKISIQFKNVGIDHGYVKGT